MPCQPIGIDWSFDNHAILCIFERNIQQLVRIRIEADKVLKDGWFNTGDMMYVDEKGKLVITGRTKDLIIHKGINVYPQEIENVLMSHPNVIRAGVIGMVDEGHGEIPIAYVQLRESQEGIEQKLKQLCIQQLAPYKVPRTIFCQTEDLPVTVTGKVDKKVLRAARKSK